jgi:hypothetical protein
LPARGYARAARYPVRFGNGSGGNGGMIRVEELPCQGLIKNATSPHPKLPPAYGLPSTVFEVDDLGERNSFPPA